ncbi:MAG: hypothetical protein J3Q66DRAFT_342277 [Benniella sp.]|nr:MAG: hypothetical protein J3Q66DRAFT_342277 [Benniella sp.]
MSVVPQQHSKITPLDIPEILSTIAQFLRRGELVQCLGVCRSWHATLLMFLWRSMALGHGCKRTPAPNPSLDALQLHGQFIHTLMIEDLFPGRFALHYPRLRTLRLYMPNPSETKSIHAIDPESIRDPTGLILHNPTLVSLFLCRLDPLLAHTFWQAVEALPHLKELTLTDSNVTLTPDPEAFSRTCAKVERLRLFRSSIPATVVTTMVQHGLPLIRELRLDAIVGLDDRSQLDLIASCPNLIDLVWCGRVLNRVSDASQSLGERARSWPALERLQLVMILRDEDLAALIATGMTRASTLNLVRSTMGPLTLQAMRTHFGTLVELKLPSHSTEAVTSGLIQDILCSCPLLEVLVGGKIAAKDVKVDRLWVCHWIKELTVCIVFEEEEQHLQPMLYERLAMLVRLERLSIAFRVGCMERSLEVQLACGLDKLSTLSELRHFSVGDRQSLGMEEVEWMLACWKKLRQIVGTLHPDTGIRERLRGHIHARGIIC